jgi:hypothetical protein
MTRTFRAGLLALPLLLAAGQAASANPYGFGIPGTRFGGCYQYGCGGFCFNLFPHLNQHGPLVNYGPYSGYYPFAPYGPWDENLRYTGPRPGDDCGWGGRACGRRGCGKCGGGGLLGRRADDGNCGGWGGYARSVFANVGHRVDPFRGKKPACSTCAH